MLKDMDIKKDILKSIVQSSKKKAEIVKHCTNLGHNKRTVYREIDRLEENEYMLFDKSTQEYFLLPYITSLNRNLLKQKEKGISQEDDYSHNILSLSSDIQTPESLRVSTNKKNISVSEDSFNLIYELISNIVLESRQNSIKDLSFEIRIKVNLESEETLTCIKNLKKTKWLPGIKIRKKKL